MLSINTSSGLGSFLRDLMELCLLLPMREGNEPPRGALTSGVLGTA